MFLAVFEQKEQKEALKQGRMTHRLVIAPLLLFSWDRKMTRSSVHKRLKSAEMTHMRVQ